MQKLLELFHIFMKLLYYRHYCQLKYQMRGLMYLHVFSLFSSLMRYPYSFAFHVNANGLFKLEAKPGKKVELSATCFVFTKTRRVFNLLLFFVCLFSFMFSAKNNRFVWIYLYGSTANIYLFKVTNKNPRKKCEKCSKL